MKRRVKISKEIIILSLIILFALFLRIYALENAPFWSDEAISSNAALKILENGSPRFDSGELYTRAYAFHYVQAFFLLFGKNDFLARFPSVIFGLLTIILGYFIGKEYSKKGGIIAALFLTVFFLEVSFSRQARFYQLFQLLFFATIYFLYKSKGNKKFLVLSIITFLLAVNTQIQAVVMAPFMIYSIIKHTRYKVASIIPAIPLIAGIIGFIKDKSLILDSISGVSFPLKYVKSSFYAMIIAVPGVIMSYMKNKRLTTLILGPSILAIALLALLKVGALRYIYIIIFPVILLTPLRLAV